jgi:hypothetical protein
MSDLSPRSVPEPLAQEVDHPYNRRYGMVLIHSGSVLWDCEYRFAVTDADLNASFTGAVATFGSRILIGFA